MHVTNHRAFRMDAEDIAHDERAQHKLMIDRWSADIRIMIGQLGVQPGQIQHSRDLTHQMISRHRIVSGPYHQITVKPERRDLIRVLASASRSAQLFARGRLASKSSQMTIEKRLIGSTPLAIRRRNWRSDEANCSLASFGSSYISKCIGPTHQSSSGHILSAFFGLDDSRRIRVRTFLACRGVNGRDGMPVNLLRGD